MIKDFLKLIAQAPCQALCQVLCIVAACGARAEVSPSTISPLNARLVLRIVPPLQCATLPGLRCYYKGDSYKLHELYCVIPGETATGLVTIIITPDIDPVYRSHRPNHWQLIEGEPFLWFECKQVCRKNTNTQTQTHTYEWIVEERLRDEVPSRIPESAIIVLTQPELIMGILPPPPSDVASARTLCNLPIIHFKRDVSPEKYGEAMIKTLSALPMIETFHSPAETR